MLMVTQYGGFFWKLNVTTFDERKKKTKQKQKPINFQFEKKGKKPALCESQNHALRLLSVLLSHHLATNLPTVNLFYFNKGMRKKFTSER